MASPNNPGLFEQLLKFRDAAARRGVILGDNNQEPCVELDIASDG